MKVILCLLIFICTSVSVAEAGMISIDRQKVTIVDTYIILNKKDQEITVYLLPCKFSKALKAGWKSESGFLKCYPINNAKYFSSPGASLTIKLNERNETGRVIFSTTMLGEKEGSDYQGFSKTWFRNSPVKDLVVRDTNDVSFSIQFKDNKKLIEASFSVNKKIDEIVNAN